jgi:hypothetical protein
MFLNTPGPDCLELLHVALQGLTASIPETERYFKPWLYNAGMCFRARSFLANHDKHRYTFTQVDLN